MGSVNCVIISSFVTLYSKISNFSHEFDSDKFYDNQVAGYIYFFNEHCLYVCIPSAQNHISQSETHDYIFLIIYIWNYVTKILNENCDINRQRLYVMFSPKRSEKEFAQTRGNFSLE